MTFLTIAAKNYLAFARVLFESVARHHPGERRVLVLVDDIEGAFDPAAEPFEVISSDALGIDGIEWLRFKYNILELSTALKPFAIDWLIEHGESRVVYLDPDIRLYAPIELPDAAVVLTPHLNAPIDDKLRPDEIDILRSGIYNLGFAAVRGDARPLLEWWKTRLHEHCWIDHAAGLFVDQKWMDLTPAIFDGVEIVRDLRWNVAFWNLFQRTRVDPVFCHYSGFNPEDPEHFAKNQTRLRLPDLTPPMQARVREYAAALIDAGFRTSRQWPYTWGQFRGGQQLTDITRRAWKQSPRLFDGIADPFGEEGYRAYFAHWNNRGLLPRRMWEANHAWQARWDDWLLFTRWLLATPQSETGLPRDLVAAIERSPGLDTYDAVRTYLHGGLTEDEFLDCLRWLLPEKRGDPKVELMTWLLTEGAAEIGLPRARWGPFERMWREMIATEPYGGAKRRLYRVRKGIRTALRE